MASRSWRHGALLLQIFCFLLACVLGVFANDGSQDVSLHSSNISGENCDSVSNKPATIKDHGHGHNDGITVASVKHFDKVKYLLAITVVVLVAGVSKLGYHRANFLSSKVPESCILVVLGIMFGVIIEYGLDEGTKDLIHGVMEPHRFFLFLLPPIILEASFSLHDRTFFDNIVSILLFAVVGTVLACVMLGCTLFGLYRADALGDLGDTTLSFTQIMTFSSLIVAVDPVAVLAVFNEIGVNQVLYFLVFGESLLNDGVTVVLYNVFSAYNEMDEILPIYYFLGFVKFIVVCFGGLAIGVLAGLATAFLTKFSTHVEVAQPLIVYVMGYFGFLLAEGFEFSGIICIIGTGIVQVHYAFDNISEQSRTTIKYFTKVIATCTEIIIFLFLGLELVNPGIYADWSWGFTVWTLVLCLVYRFVIMFGMTSIINRLTGALKHCGRQDMFMISYGGLRGAVCFSLVKMLNVDENNPDVMSRQVKNLFTTTTLAVIMFTVFVQGSTIKPLVNFFQIKLAQEKSSSVYDELCEHFNDHLMAGLENIIGQHGSNHFRKMFEHFDHKYLKKHLQVAPDPRVVSLQSVYENLLLKEHYDSLKLSGAKDVPETPELPRTSRYALLQSLDQIGEQDNEDDEISPARKICDRSTSLIIDMPKVTWSNKRTPSSVWAGMEAKRKNKKHNKNLTLMTPSPVEDDIREKSKLNNQLRRRSTIAVSRQPLFVVKDDVEKQISLPYCLHECGVASRL